MGIQCSGAAAQQPGTEEARTINQPDTFTKSVIALLDQVEYRRCETGEDIEAIYRLRYDSYLATEMVGPNPSRMVVDEYDDLPNSYRFGVFIDGALVSTIRLHHVSAEHPRSPSMTVFGDALRPRLEAGETFVDPSRFAADLDVSKQHRVLPYITLRLAVVACGYFDPTYCLTAIKEEHAGFYKRIFNASQALPARMYPGLMVPVYLFQSRTSENMENTLRRFPFFRSTAAERRMLFAQPRPGELAPLTILPTAKYYRPAA
jgi:hypothetical protein